MGTSTAHGSNSESFRSGSEVWSLLADLDLPPVGSEEFERLEFLGDPILELIVLLDRLDDATTAGALKQDLSLRTSDRRWSQLAQAHSLQKFADRPLGPNRQADLVEATAAQVYVRHGWRATKEYAIAIGATSPDVAKQDERELTIEALGHPWLDAPDPAFVATAQSALGVTFGNPAWISHALSTAGAPDRIHAQGHLAAIGVQVVELAIAFSSYFDQPEWRVGQLSDRTARVRARSRIEKRVEHSRLTPLVEGLPRPSRGFYALVGAVLADQGRDACIRAATRVVGLPARKAMPRDPGVGTPEPATGAPDEELTVRLIRRLMMNAADPLSGSTLGNQVREVVGPDVINESKWFSHRSLSGLIAARLPDLVISGHLVLDPARHVPPDQGTKARPSK